MAYVIYCEDKNPSEFSRIAENTTERDNLLHGTMRSHEISTNDFNDLKNNLKFASGWDGTNITYTSLPRIENQQELENYINSLIYSIEKILKYDYGVSMSHWETYLDYLKNVDTSNISTPMDSWEKYCSDNSITYYSLLQRP